MSIAGCGRLLGLDEPSSPEPPIEPGIDASTVDSSGSTDIDSSTNDGSADDATSPADANPCGQCLSKHCEADGGCHPLVFVTSGTTRGNLGNQAPSDGYAKGRALCNSYFADSGAHFDPWIHYPFGAPANTIKSTRPYRRVDGVVVTTSIASALSTGVLENPIDVMENGAKLPVDGGVVWTGTTASGASTGLHCAANGGSVWADGQNAEGGNYGTVGLASVTSSQWANRGELECNQQAHLYCFESQP